MLITLHAQSLAGWFSKHLSGEIIVDALESHDISDEDLRFAKSYLDHGLTLPPMQMLYLQEEGPCAEQYRLLAHTKFFASLYALWRKSGDPSVAHASVCVGILGINSLAAPSSSAECHMILSKLHSQYA